MVLGHNLQSSTLLDIVEIMFPETDRGACQLMMARLEHLLARKKTR
jgi:hypothetical protein